MAWWDTHITQGFLWTWNNTKAHSGIDLAEDNGTPLSAAVSGRVIHAGQHDWGGQVSILFETHGQEMTLSYLHLSDFAPGISAGQDITAGTYIGKSGGATWSGPMPTGSKYSSGPHLHFELWVGNRAPYVDQSPWRPDEAHYPIDPTNMFYALKNNGIVNDQSAFGFTSGGSSGASSDQSGGEGPTPSAKAHQVLQDAPGFAGIVSAIDAGMTPQPWSPPKQVNPTVTGDIQFSIGPYTEQVHVPAISDIARAQANAQNTASIFTYAVQYYVNNFAAIHLRLACVILGLLLILALLYAQIRKSESYQAAQGAAKTAATAAVVAAI